MDTLLREPKESEVPMNKKQKRQKFSKEFKADAISLVLEQGYSNSEVGRRLGIHHSSVARWVREHRERQESPDGLVGQMLKPRTAV
jgi:transposase-like protein